MEQVLEIVEGPGAGRMVPISGPLVIGRDSSADVVLDDTEVSRKHARITPGPSGVIVEDLNSTNGTFVDGAEVHSAVPLRAGAELVTGVTVFQLRSATQPTAVRAVPPALAVPERRPDYVPPADEAAQREGIPELERLLDRRTKARAAMAPFAVVALAALAVIIYLGAR